MDASTSDYVGYWYANISPLFFLHLDLSPALRIHRADESKGPSPLTPQNFITLHNIGQKYLADKGDKTKSDFWTYHAVTRSCKGKVETYLKEYKYRLSILQENPRAAADQEQEVVGLFINYDAGASFTNQEPAPVNMKLAFTEAHVSAYDSKSAQVVTSLADKLTGDKLVKQFVAFCACELKFLYGCSVPWDKLPVAGQSEASDQASDPASVPASRSPSPKPKLTQAPSPKTKAQALSSGGEEGGNSDTDAYGSGDDRGGDRNVQFTMFDPENIYDIDWTAFKYPVAGHFVPRFKEAHAVAAMFHLNAELAAKFPVLNGQINTGWQAYYKKPIHVDQILQPPSIGELGWEDDEVEWLEQTVRYYVEPMTREQRSELGITPEQARRILKKSTGKVRPLLSY